MQQNTAPSPTRKDIFPPKLKQGDTVRIVAPSESLVPRFNIKMQEQARDRLLELGFHVSYGRHILEADEFKSSTVEHRLEDFHEAFADKSIKALVPVMGGTTSNQLLKHLDYDLIGQNPKILCGLSDITALCNAIFAKTGLVTYYGPHLSVFAASRKDDHTMQYFRKCLMEGDAFDIFPSDKYYTSEWEHGEEHANDGFWAINEGEACGKVLGGNLLTFNLLHGTEFMPEMTGAILFFEDNGKESADGVQNQVQALLNNPCCENISGLVFGRFQPRTRMTRELFTKIILSKEELREIPVAANVDFGHTLPMITFPLGGQAGLTVKDGKVRLKIIRH